MDDLNRRGLLGAAAAVCGGKGMGPAELAARLGWPRAEVRGRVAEQAAMGEALERAQDAALAWWEARARLWASQGRSNASLWGKAMAGRFAEDGYGPPGRAPAARDLGPPRRTKPVTNRDRAKAVAMLFAEAGMKFGEVEG